MPTAFNLEWDQTGDRLYEVGTDRGVLYPISNGQYPIGYAWNGLTSVTESPSGADSNAIWADNIKYLELRGAEEFGGTIEAYTYPDEWAECDGSKSFGSGKLSIGQQNRKAFGLCYRTLVGNDTEHNDFGYKLHLIYNATASPSERQYSTVNDSPDAVTFSWEFTTTPINVGAGHKPTAIITIDSTKFATEQEKQKLTDLEKILYGTAAEGNSEAVAARLPLPAEVFSTLGITLE